MSADVVVIGGGPAGSATAAFLARSGHTVILLEKEQFPRFHVGESLLPMALPVLEELGVDLGAQGYQWKAGARFLDEDTEQSATYLFCEGLAGGHPPHAYQVDRARFDHELLQVAQADGVEVRQGTTVVDARIGADAVDVHTNTGPVRARYLVDASGQSAFLARRAKSLRAIRNFGRAAAFVRYAGLGSDAWNEIQPEGNVQIIRRGTGWAWAIPLSDRGLSVGVVAREGAMCPEDALRLVEQSPLLRRWTQGTQCGRPGLVGDYSFRNTKPAGGRFVCVGDSACFLDPVFSSGVTVGLLGAQRLASILGPALAQGKEGDAGLMAPLEDYMAPAYKSFYALIHRFYNTAILDNLFFAAEPDPTYRAGLVTMLAGDVWRDDNAFQNMVMASSRQALTEVF